VPSMLLLPERSYRWNFVVMGLDISLFTLALTFASVYGVLPLFVHHLTNSNVALGLIPAVRALGTLLPPILVAAYVQRLRRRKPFVLAWTVFERLPYLVLAVLTPVLAGAHPTLLLWLFFAMIAVGTCAGGITSPAWLDLVARVLPDDWRGRFFGLWSALGSLLGLGGGVLTAALLRLPDWPTGFALCFGCAFGCLIVSFVFLATTREGAPTERTAPATNWRGYAVLVRRDRNFAGYLTANGLVTLAGMATAFYAVDAERALHLSDAGAGLYGVVLLAASLAGNILWGYVGDHTGHKRVLELGALCTGLAAGVAVASVAVASHTLFGGIILYGAAFALVGLGSSAVQLAALTVVLDFAAAEDRPTYIGIASLAQVPFACAAPVVGGVIADRLGYGAVFVLTVLLGLAGAAMVVKKVRDPRHAAAVTVPAPGLPARAGARRGK